MTLETLWSLLNSPIVISALASVLVLALNWVYASRPLWKQYEGTIASAIRYAEKAIPDGSGNTAVERLDAALKYVLLVYEAREGKKANGTVEVEFKEAIQTAHALTPPELL